MADDIEGGNPSERKGGFTTREALFYHETIRPGKLEIVATKPMTSQRDLSLAYSRPVTRPKPISSPSSPTVRPF